MTAAREQELLDEIRQRDEQIAQLEARLARSEEQNRLLMEKVDKLCRKIFGKSSEQIDPAQMELMLGVGSGLQGTASEGAGLEDPVVVPFEAPRRSRKPFQRRVPEDLPLIETVVEPPEVTANPEKWRKIDQEVTKLLDYEPGRFLRRHLIRPKYVSREDNTLAPVIAPLNSLQERCTAAPGLLAYVVTAKYCHHLPLYRLEGMFRLQSQVNLSRQTLDGWVELVADSLRLVYQHLCETVFACGYVQIDETHVRYLAPGNGKTKQGYFWVANAPGVGVAFYWQTSRAASCLENIVPVDFSGTIQRDGYSSYDAFVRKRAASQIVLAGCMAHVRRAFYDARKTAPGPASWILHQFQLLYRVEERLREANAGPSLRHAVRQSESRVIYQRLGRCIEKLSESKRYLPQGGMGKALSYAQGQWESAGRFLEDGKIEIDNNGVENAIRPSAVGKKNWLFIGSAEAGQQSAILYTIVENCRMLEVDPYAYLKWVLTKIPTATNQQIAELTPAAFVNAQAPPLRQAS